MSEKFKNIVCEPKDIAQNIQRQFLEFLGLKQTVCTVITDDDERFIRDFVADAQNLDPSQKVINLLLKIASIFDGINTEKMKKQLIAFLVKELKPLSESLSADMIDLIKSCYACKVEPLIPEWLFQIQPSTIQYDGNGNPIPNTGVEGIGINIPLEQIDLSCIFAADPNTEKGKLFYDGVCSNGTCNDMSAFLWEVLQLNGEPLIWKDPTTGREILEVRYYEDSPIAFTKYDGNVNSNIFSTDSLFQNTNPVPRVFNFRLVNETYQNKTIITFLVDYFNSQQPLFNVDRAIPTTIDILYGTLTNSIDLPDECLTKIAELEEALDDYAENGVDNFEITFDDSFYSFNDKQKEKIRDRVAQKKSGVKLYTDCCGVITSTISFESLNEINEDISNASTFQERLNTYTNSFDKLIDESTKNIKSKEINLLDRIGDVGLDLLAATAEFISKFIQSLWIGLSRLILSPKNLVAINLFYYLANGKPVEVKGIKAQLREYECIIRCLFAKILRNIIYGFLLPQIIAVLKNLAKCYIAKLIKERYKDWIKVKLSLLPSFINQRLEGVNELLGKTSDSADAANTFFSGINLDSLESINLRFGRKNKGRFCD